MFGFLLSAVVVFAHAETKPADTTLTYTRAFTGVAFWWAEASSLSAACDSHSSASTTYAIIVTGSVHSCKSTRLVDGYSETREATYTGLVCDAGDMFISDSLGVRTCRKTVLNCESGWTLEGSNCTRPDCVAPETRDPATGLCENPCEASTGITTRVSLKTGSSGIQNGPFCNGSCRYRYSLDTSQSDDDVYISKDSSGQQYISAWQTQIWIGEQCTETSGAESPDSPQPPTPRKPPPCATGEGVLTSSSGNVACVPAGVPTAQPPEVGKKKKTETFPDGSTKTTETTTTTDPATGAEHTHTISTSSGGLAGSAGTTTSTEDGSKDSDGDGQPDDNGEGDGDGDCEGNDCGGGNAFPEVGGLWEKKYPDGLGKVIRDKIDLLKSTSLGGLIQTLAPSNLPGGGSCPNWSVGFNLGSGMNFGSSALGMPCGVWDFIKIVFLITSLLAARRIVFGG